MHMRTHRDIHACMHTCRTYTYIHTSGGTRTHTHIYIIYIYMYYTLACRVLLRYSATALQIQLCRGIAMRRSKGCLRPPRFAGQDFAEESRGEEARESFCSAGWGAVGFRYEGFPFTPVQDSRVYGSGLRVAISGFRLLKRRLGMKRNGLQCMGPARQCILQFSGLGFRAVLLPSCGYGGLGVSPVVFLCFIQIRDESILVKPWAWEDGAGGHPA